MADVCDSAQPGVALDETQIRAIIDGISSPRALAWMNAAELVENALSDREQIGRAVIEMMASRKAHVRFNALCCVTRATPVEIADAALQQGLRDKSARVKWKAAQQASALGRRNLTSDMEATLATMSAGKPRDSVESSLRLLRDGYILKPVGDGTFNLTLPTAGGGTSGRSVTERELRERGLDAIMAELRAR